MWKLFPTQEECYSGQTPMYTALWQRKRAQRCDSENKHTVVTAVVVTVLRQWCTHLVWQRWQLTVLWQRCDLPLLLQWCAHRCYTNKNTAVTALPFVTAVTALSVPPLSVVIDVTLVCTVMLQRWHCHRCCTVASLHRWHTVAAIAVTVLSRPLLSQHS